MANPDLTAYLGGREQAYVKHCLLQSYLPDLGFKVGSAWENIIYIDGFSGPWDETCPQLSDTSFAIGINALRKVRDALARRDVRIGIHAFLVEKEEAPFLKLNSFAKTQNVPGCTVEAFRGEFVTHVPAILERASKLRRPFKFVFLDPMGWKDIPMETLRTLTEGRSNEVLINLMTKHITRFLDEDSRADSFKRLFGRDEVLPELQKMPPGNADRADRAVREYCRSLHRICGFKYVSQAVILEPGREEVRYYLVYATNHHRGIEVFKEAEITAAKLQAAARDEVRAVKIGGMLDFGAPVETRIAVELRKRYKARARAKVLESLGESGDLGIEYSEIFCDAMAFPLVTPADLLLWIEELQPHVQPTWSKVGDRKLRKPDIDNPNHRVVIADRERLEALVN